jgi:thiol-disulfide isomerase/thioredoxin
MRQLKWYNLIMAVALVMVQVQVFAQADSGVVFKIQMNEIARPLNYVIEEMHGTWKLDLYKYPPGTITDTCYLFFLYANQSSSNPANTIFDNVVPGLLVKGKTKTYFILNSKKDFDFSARNDNRVFYPNDTVDLKLNNKQYNFYLTIGDTAAYTNLTTRNFPGLDTISGYNRVINNIFISFKSLNKKTGHFMIDTKQFWITAIDGNFNGLYNDKMVDKVGIRSSKEAAIFDAGFVGYDENIAFPLDGTTKINFSEVTGDGALYTAEKQPLFTIFKQHASNFFQELRIVDTIPNFIFPLLNDDKKELNKLFEGKDYLLIYQWGLWCSGCYMETEYLLKNYAALNRHMNIVGFNYKDEDPEKVKAYVQKEQIPWAMAKSNLTIYQNIFKRMGFPAAILIRKDLTVQKYFAMPYYLNVFLK